MRTININFQQVKDFVMNNTEYSVEAVVDATEPFVMDYLKHPYGFAETDNKYDISELLDDIDDCFYGGIASEPDGRIRRGLLSSAIKREVTRWKEGRNAGAFGRYIGRLAHVLNERPVPTDSTVNEIADLLKKRSKLLAADYVCKHIDNAGWDVGFYTSSHTQYIEIFNDDTGKDMYTFTADTVEDVIVDLFAHFYPDQIGAALEIVINEEK